MVQIEVVMKLVTSKEIGVQLHNVLAEHKALIEEYSDVNLKIDFLEKLCKFRVVGEYKSITHFSVKYAIFEREEDFTWFILKWS